MQKKLIAVAVAGLLSGAAFAQTSVTIGGKVDVGYDFTRTANADAAGTGGNNGAPQGGTTTETQTDGRATSSRITIVAKEDLGAGYSAEVNMDLRFSGGYEQGKTGLTTSDKRTLILRTPLFINALWGVSNLGGQIYFGVGEKPYMVSPKDLEIVKYGVSQLRESSLTSRNTTLFTSPINAGPVSLLFHATHAFGDNRTSGTSNVGSPQTGGGDVRAAGVEWKVTDMVNGGFDFNQRQTTLQNTGTVTPAVAGKNGIVFSHTYVNVKPVKGLKVAASFNTYRGYDGAGGDFDEKNTNLVFTYNFNDKLEVGLGLSRLNDLASTRNSGSAWMLGGAYFFSKSVFVYAAHSRTDFARNQSGLLGKYDGTVAGFSTTLNKLDGHTTRFGIVKEF